MLVLGMKTTEFLEKRLFCLMLVALLLSTNFAPVFAADGDAPVDPNAGNASEGGDKPVIETTVVRAEFECRSPDSNPEEKVLDPKEVEKLKQALNVDGKGFVGEKPMAPGQVADKDRKLLGNPQSAVVVPTGKGKEVQLQEVPPEKFSPNEMQQWMNQTVNGPFSIGLSLYDTLRMGRCENLDKMEAAKIGCPMEGKQIELRNSGEGIIAGFGRVTDDFGDIFGEAKDFITRGKSIPGYSEEEENLLKENLALEPDANSLEYKKYMRERDPIPNSIKTESFSTSMGSTCNTEDCVISSYSMFDKYFNSWFAADLVVSNFGPTLFGQAKRYLTYPSRHGWGWGLEKNRVSQWIRREFAGPDSWYGQMRAQRMVAKAREHGFGEFWTKMVENNDWDSGYTAFKGGGFRKWLNDATKPGGYIDEITDPIRKGEFYKLVKDMRGYSRANRDIINAAHDAYNTTLTRYGVGSLEARHALVEYGRTNYHMMDQMDELLSIDAPEWFLRDAYANMYPYAVKHAQSGSIVSLVGDSQHIDNIGRKFVADGDWVNFQKAGNAAYETTGRGGIQLYEVAPDGRFIDSVPVEDLKKNFSRFRDKMVKTEKGELLKLDEVNIDYIVNSVPGAGKVPVYDLKWKAGPELTPELFASKLTHSRVRGRFAGSFNENFDFLHNALVERNFAGMDRTYYSVLDRAMARDGQILKSYLSLRGGAKWTAMPFVYWGAKRGFGEEGLSAFMLPETWRQLEFYLGTAQLYDDAFVDFFAQHGSDEGDIFRQVLNKLPWKAVLNYISDEYNPLKETFDKLTGRGWRPTVENIALFSSTGEKCAGCTSALKFEEEPSESEMGFKGELGMTFDSKKGLKNYLLEDALSAEARKEGSTLIMFGHHTNVKGEAEDIEEGNETDLIQGQKDKETCRDKVKELGLGFGWLGETALVQNNAARMGGLIAFTESLSYAIFGWSGIIGSVLTQTLIAPELQGCVDDQEGYFVHMFAPSEEGQEGQQSGNQKAAEKATDVIKNFMDTQFGGETTAKDSKDKKEVPDSKDKKTVPAKEGEEKTNKNFLEVAKDKVRETVQSLEDKQRTNTMLQITAEAVGTSTGVLVSKEIFFYWFSGERTISKYDDKTKAEIIDSNSGKTVLIDKVVGQILVNGKPVITSTEHARMTTANGNIPAYEIPQRIGEIKLPTNSADPMFEWHSDGRFVVLSQEVLDCIKRNIEQQTGVGISSDSITDAFGNVESIGTNGYTINVDTAKREIVASGTPRRIVYGDNAVALVRVNRQTVLKNGEEEAAGLFYSVNFKNGVILYNAKENELQIWLKRNEKTIASKSDISGLKATPTTVKNPETDCPEPAINLEALPVGGSAAIAERVDNLNLGLQKQGPFQTFDTDKHRFIFYSKLQADGSCEDRVKIINKETGEVYDQALVGPVENTPTGVKFKTADGKEHTLDFSADDGVPKISYNNGAPEVLRTAQGPNGSFWYDPTTGQWYPENAQLIPLLEAFKKNGFGTSVGSDGKVASTPGGNNLSVNIGTGSEMPFNLPSLPQNPFLLLLFVSALLGVIIVARVKIEGCCKGA